MYEKKTTIDTIARNKNTILFSLITGNNIESSTTKEPSTTKETPNMASAVPDASSSSPSPSPSPSSLLTKNPIMFTKEEAKVSSKWKKYIYKIHTLIMDEIPNMCLVDKSNNKYEYESSCGTQKVKFICRFEGVPARQYCTGVIIDNGRPIYHKTKKTPKRLYRSLIRYIDDYYVDYILDLNKKYSGPYPQPTPILCLDKGITPESQPSALCPISPVANHTGPPKKTKTDFYGSKKDCDYDYDYVDDESDDW